MTFNSKIFDIFLFNNELDLLEIRLNLLYEHVDYFILGESKKTFSELDKDLFYEKNKDTFEKFNDKIIHVVVPEPSEEDLVLCDKFYNLLGVRSYARDTFEKDYLKNKVSELCSDEDIILWSDLDEVPNPEVLKEIESFYNPNEVYNFAQDNFQGYLNWVETTGLIRSQTADFEYEDYPRWVGTKMCSYAILKKYTLTQMRQELPKENNARIYPGGWHWSTVGGPEITTYEERVIKKIKGAAHTEQNIPEIVDMVSHRIANDLDPIGRTYASYKTLEVDDFFPTYIIENKDKYAHLIKT